MNANAYVLEAGEAIQQLQRFGAITAPPAPNYHGYLGSVTNAAISLLALCVDRRTGEVVFPQLTDDQWGVLVVVVHRAFYSGLLTAVEGMCDGFCKSRGAVVISRSLTA